MRITNNMMLRTTASNINTNKLNVNSLNNQMSSQKKILWMRLRDSLICILDFFMMVVLRSTKMIQNMHQADVFPL